MKFLIFISVLVSGIACFGQQVNKLNEFKDEIYFTRPQVNQFSSNVDGLSKAQSSYNENNGRIGIFKFYIFGSKYQYFF